MADKQEILKKRKKKWYSILAPKEFNNVSIGESYVDDINLLKGRILKVNLMSVTNDLKKQNINVGFVVDEIKGDHACAKLISYEITPSYIRRLTKKSKTKIDDSFKCISLDKVGLVVKPMIVTKNEVNKSVSTYIRKITREFIIDFLNKKDYNEFIKAVVSNNLQRELKEKLNKVTPILVCVIRVFKIISK